MSPWELDTYSTKIASGILRWGLRNFIVTPSHSKDMGPVTEILINEKYIKYVGKALEGTDHYTTTDAGKSWLATYCLMNGTESDDL